MNEMRDRADDLAAVLCPVSDPGPTGETDDEVLEAALQARRELAESFRLMESQGVDPLLAALSGAYRRKLEAEQEMRLLITYGREFAWPRPYRLIDLAQNAGLSTSGIRIAYRHEDVDEVARAIGRSPQSHLATPIPSGGENDE